MPQPSTPSARAETSPPTDTSPYASSPDFAVFCQSRRARYEEYARLRTGDRVLGVETVGATFVSLARQWQHILRGSSPAADAWHMLGLAVEAVGTDPASESTEEALYDALPTREADAVSLHYLLGMTLTSAADLMGAEASTVAAHLLTAERTLPTHLVRTLERRPSTRG
ncbi:sigma factor-like helix-turn-helix DNA-binding protein [Streptomyces sp. SID3343]|uniref:sigma factor-like helix-turn-helix DNA-binding protein n=1 Tax=Streptomyces sp. SID3343 TaxID=2690260 RepID=UPI00136F7686|nr:sigma factor-like helix-turn-helix DNA-binding protein [Streptomyces sp. SID3343]MYV98387.1 hypothetical protein [Streptomyces sp. SID3343]